MGPMRRLAALVVLVVLSACAGDDDVALDRERATTTEPPATTTTASTTTTSTTSPAQAVAAGECPRVPARATPPRDRPRYVLRVDADPVQGLVEGDVVVRFRPDLDTDRLVFRLWPNGPRPAARGVRLEVGPVTGAGGHALPSQQPDPTTLVVTPAGGLRRGQEIEVAVPWRLTIPGPVEDRVSHNGDSLRLGSFFPVLAWEPGIGWATEPPTSGFAESATMPTADFAVSVTLPAGYSALATGVPDGAGRWRAEAVRDFAMSIGRFETVTAVADAPHSVQVTVGVHRGVAEAPDRYLAKVVAVLEDFATRYGPYPWPAYSLALTPGLGGGIEFPMHVMQGPETIGRTTSHEVAHMWFYALVGNNQGRDPWLDEGLATWAEARYEDSVAALQARDIPAAGRGQAGQPMTFWETRQSAYYRSVYVQPAVALAALGSADLVDCALRHYVAAEAYDIARDDDLLRSLELIFPGARATLAPFGLVP